MTGAGDFQGEWQASRAFGPGRSTYRRWDGTQDLGDLDPDKVLDALSDAVLEDGDVEDALQRLIEEGMPATDGTRGMRGLRDLLERLASRRSEALDSHGLGDVLGDIRRQLEEIVETERRGIARRLTEADGAGDSAVDGERRPDERSRPAGGGDGQGVSEHRAGGSDDGAPSGGRPGARGSGPEEDGDASSSGRGEPGNRGGQSPGGTGQDRALRRLLRDTATRHGAALDGLPRGVGDRIRALQDYEFLEPAARDAFQDLVERLRGQMLDATFEGLADQLRGFSPEDLAANREMVRDLDRLLQQRLDGRDPDVSDFLARHGSFFPGAQTLDDIIEQLADRMAAMQSLLSSLSAAQRSELASLADALLRDDRLRWDLQHLADTLDQLLPGGLGERLPFRGEDNLSLEGALREIQRLQELDRLSEALADAGEPGGLQAVDRGDVARLLGEDAARELDALQRLESLLEEAGYVERRGDRLELTPAGHRRIGARVLDELFARLRRDALGGHAVRNPGIAGERSGTSVRYEFGRPFDLDLRGTLDNALARTHSDRMAPADRVGPAPAHGGGPGSGLVAGDRAVPSVRPRGERAASGPPPGRPRITLEPGDFAVHEAEEQSRAATVLLVDMSRSMLLRGCYLAAKKVAIALDTLIRTRFPRDELHVIGFAYVAREIRPGTLTGLSWHGYEYGTNLQHGLQLARQRLARSAGGNRSIIVVTDGEPTAHIEDGRVEFAYPPTRRTVDETLREVQRCTRDGITINTFMLERSRSLTAFVDRMTQLNRGRAFYATPERLGEYVLVDYMDRRTRRIA